MSDDQALRLIEIALRQREEFAEKAAVIVLDSDLTNFIPEAAKGEFSAWCAAQESSGSLNK